ncbi:MAG: YjfB family protein [Butyrivibrio sp.]|uniref:YjfB family protein n=1 Tax=Butyrivibrio sp. TaxID=28121 RepID=UPI0025E53B91|nr:YjfB family protein [Butyrivibrio sp.]MCR5770423.1 YjfB family protein [Butyrivibrio sp.]
MDIAKLSTQLSMSKLQSDFGVAMFAKQLDTYQDMGEAMTDTLDVIGKQLELSVNPSVGGNFDASV